MGHHLGTDAALVIEVEVLQGLAGREASGADAGLAAVGGTGRDLPLQAGGQELLVAPGLLPGSGPQTFHPTQQGRGLHLATQVGEVAGPGHHAIPSNLS